MCIHTYCGCAAPSFPWKQCRKGSCNWRGPNGPQWHRWEIKWNQNKLMTVMALVSELEMRSTPPQRYFRMSFPNTHTYSCPFRICSQLTTDNYIFSFTFNNLHFNTEVNVLKCELWNHIWDYKVKAFMSKARWTWLVGPPITQLYVWSVISEGVCVILVHYRDQSHICHHPLEAYRDMFILWDFSDEMCHQFPFPWRL